MTAEPLQRIKLSRPADVVAIIPYLVGYHPERSLVAMSLRGPRRRVGLTLRLDLPPTSSCDRAIAADVGARMKHDGAHTVVLVVYDDDPAGDGEPPRTALATAVAAACGGRGLRLQDAILVRGGRWRSYLCADQRCCPPEGTLIIPAGDPGGASPVVAAAAYAGLAPLPSRQALAEVIAPVSRVRRASMEQALDRAADRLATALGAGLEPVVAESVRRLDAAVDGYADPAQPAALSDDGWADLVVRLRLVPVRDEVLGWATGPYAEALRELLLELVRRAVPPQDLVPLTVLAWVVYLQGGGTLASIALERALTRDPSYGLALILDEALARSVAPRALRRARLPLRVGRHRPAGRRRARAEGDRDAG